MEGTDLSARNLQEEMQFPLEICLLCSGVSPFLVSCLVPFAA
jgi:hypothetical protein